MAGLSFDIFAVDKASDVIRGIGESVEGQAGKWDKWKVAGAAAGAVVGAAVWKFANDSIDAYQEAQASQAIFDDAFARFPALADVNKDALQAYNGELAKKVRFDDDALSTGQAALAQYGLTGTQIKDLTPLLADYAAKTGKDLPDAAKDLGKAMLGQGKALKSIGLDFKDAGSTGANFDQVMSGLRTQVGGFAEKEGKTAAGQSAILGNQFGELQEAAGAQLLPVLQRLATVGLEVVGWINDNQRTAVILVGTVLGLAGVFGVMAAATSISAAATGAWGVATGIASGISAIGQSTAATWVGVKLLEVGAWLSSTAAVAGNAIGLGAYAVASGVVRGATLAWTGVQWALNAALSANPIGLVVVGIGLLVAGFVLAWQHSEQFREIVMGSLHAVGDFFVELGGTIKGWALDVKDWLVDKVGDHVRWLREKFEDFKTGLGIALGGARDAIGWIKDKASAVKDWVSDNWPLLLGILTGPIGLAVVEIATHWTQISDGAKDLFARIKAAPADIATSLKYAFEPLWTGFRGVANKIIGGWNALSFTIGGGSFMGVDIPKITVDTPNLPMLATGGTAVGAGLALVGERGPEIISMPVGASVVPLPRAADAVAATMGMGGATTDPGAVAHRAAARREAADTQVRLAALERALTTLPKAIGDQLLTALRQA